MNCSKKNLTCSEIVVCGICFLFYFCWAVVQPYNAPPDEAMRYTVTLFLFQHDRLPVGAELISHWGFSYAHYPAVLCSQIGYVFMKFASLFSESTSTLLMAARMVSVVCGTGTVYFTIKASKRLIHSPARWIFVVFVAAMPQTVYLNSYVNNDSVALLGTAMIFYAWTLGIADGWNYRNATLLAIGISVCALAYYNSYAWILCSIIFLSASCLIHHKNNHARSIKLIAYVAAIVLLLISYSFIRHIVLYNDLLGFKTCAYYGELYAIDELKPSVRTSLAEAGVPLSEMLFGSQYRWLQYSWTSFIGAFGYMIYFCPEIVYGIITGIMLLSGVALIVKFIRNIKLRSPKDTVLCWFNFCLAFSSVITVILSIIQSYYRDYQPQGRYCYPALIPLAFATAKGYEYIFSHIKKKESCCIAVAAVCTTMICLLLFVFLTVFLPSLQ